MVNGLLTRVQAVLASSLSLSLSFEILHCYYLKRQKVLNHRIQTNIITNRRHLENAVLGRDWH